MLVLLHGAKKNVGDFLIFERARALIQRFVSDEELVELPRWLPLDDQIETINKARAVFLCGGPAYASNFYPGIFPLTTPLDAIQVPIVPMALGWSGAPAGHPEQFQFTPESLAAIQSIHASIPTSSVRDVITEQIIRVAGVDNVTMTGCAAWYALDHIDRDFTPPGDVRRIVVSSPAVPRHYPQAVRVLQLIQQHFPGSERYLVFHRGILPDSQTGLVLGSLNAMLAAAGLALGYRNIDAGYNTDHIAFYKDCDLHIGYRVHAHIAFLSYRRPSILIQEDGRGAGQTATLGTEDLWARDPDFSEKLRATITHHLDTDFAAYEAVIGRMQTTFSSMRGFLETIRSHV